MDDERQEQGCKEGRPCRRIRLPRQLWVFPGILLLECALAAGLLLLWAYVAFHLRLSTELIRAGIVLLYMLPCLCGGHVARNVKLRPAPLWGAGLGMAFYTILWVVAALVASSTDAAGEVLVLCVASAIFGSLFG